MTTSVVVSSLAFTEDGGVIINFMDVDADIRNTEKLMMSHQLLIGSSDGRDYGDEIEDVRDAVNQLLADALEDFRAPKEDIRE